MIKEEVHMIKVSLRAIFRNSSKCRTKDVVCLITKCTLIKLKVEVTTINRTLPTILCQ